MNKEFIIENLYNTDSKKAPALTTQRKQQLKSNFIDATFKETKFSNEITTNKFKLNLYAFSCDFIYHDSKYINTNDINLINTIFYENKNYEHLQSEVTLKLTNIITNNFSPLCLLNLFQYNSKAQETKVIKNDDYEEDKVRLFPILYNINYYLPFEYSNEIIFVDINLELKTDDVVLKMSISEGELKNKEFSIPDIALLLDDFSNSQSIKNIIEILNN